MKHLRFKSILISVAALFGSFTLLVAPVAAVDSTATSTTTTTGTTSTEPKTPKTTKTTPSTSTTTGHAQNSNEASQQSIQDTARVQRIISRGNSEIERRLHSLDNVSKRINSLKKLTDTEKADVQNIITSNQTALTTLKAKLDADAAIPDPATALAAAQTDAQSIITGYRIYALIIPQIDLIKTADDQQAIEAKLTTVSGKLTTRITAAQTAGKDVSSLQASLIDMNSQIAAAETISSSLETKIVAINPSDYNDNHTVLAQYKDQLKTAHDAIKAAVADGKKIVAGLK